MANPQNAAHLSPPGERSAPGAAPGHEHDAERLRRQRLRSLAIGLGLGALVVIFYVATIVRLGPNALRKDGFSRPSAGQVVAPGAGGPSRQGEAAGGEAACKKAGTC